MLAWGIRIGLVTALIAVPGAGVACSRTEAPSDRQVAKKSLQRPSVWLCVLTVGEGEQERFVLFYPNSMWLRDLNDPGVLAVGTVDELVRILDARERRIDVWPGHTEAFAPSSGLSVRDVTPGEVRAFGRHAAAPYSIH